MEDKDIADMFADGTMKVKNMWIWAYDSESGNKGWISMDSVISDIVSYFEPNNTQQKKENHSVNPVTNVSECASMTNSVEARKGCGELFGIEGYEIACGEMAVGGLFLCKECTTNNKKGKGEGVYPKHSCFLPFYPNEINTQQDERARKRKLDSTSNEVSRDASQSTSNKWDMGNPAETPKGCRRSLGNTGVQCGDMITPNPFRIESPKYHMCKKCTRGEK